MRVADSIGGDMKGKYSKGIVVLIIALNVFFSAAVLIVFWHTGNEPSNLILAWYAFTTGELWLLSGIKKKKVEGKNENRLDS